MIDHHTIDPENMHKSIFEFPDHIIEALELGNKITLHNNYENIKNIVVAGMGGSAMESLIRQGRISAVMDFSLVEVSN